MRDDDLHGEGVESEWTGGEQQTEGSCLQRSSSWSWPCHQLCLLESRLSASHFSTRHGWRCPHHTSDPLPSVHSVTGRWISVIKQTPMDQWQKCTTSQELRSVPLSLLLKHEMSALASHTSMISKFQWVTLHFSNIKMRNLSRTSQIKKNQ